jgi:hypothetical protein
MFLLEIHKSRSAWITPRLRAALRTSELKALELLHDAGDPHLSGSEADRAEPVGNRDGWSAERLREGPGRSLDDQFGPQGREHVARRLVRSGVVHADNHGMTTLAKRPKSWEGTNVLHGRQSLYWISVRRAREHCAGPLPAKSRHAARRGLAGAADTAGAAWNAWASRPKVSAASRRPKSRSAMS